jgi:hypothetical protein
MIPPRDLPSFPERNSNEILDNLNRCTNPSCHSKLIKHEGDEQWQENKKTWLLALICIDCGHQRTEDVIPLVREQFNRNQSAIRGDISAAADALALSIKLGEIDIFAKQLEVGYILPEDF